MEITPELFEITGILFLGLMYGAITTLLFIKTLRLTDRVADLEADLTESENQKDAGIKDLREGFAHSVKLIHQTQDLVKRLRHKIHFSPQVTAAGISEELDDAVERRIARTVQSVLSEGPLLDELIRITREELEKKLALPSEKPLN